MDNENKIHAIRTGNNKSKNLNKSNHNNYMKHPQEKVGKNDQRAQLWRSSTRNMQQQYSSRFQDSACSRCGRIHRPQECPAYGKTCRNFGGKNHFESVCKFEQKVNLVENEAEENSLFLGTVDYKNNILNNNINIEWYENVLINKNSTIRAKLDTGAQCNIISINELLNKIKNHVTINKS